MRGDTRGFGYWLSYSPLIDHNDRFDRARGTEDLAGGGVARREKFSARRPSEEGMADALSAIVCLCRA